jgi:midasin (ATPase involved in ribosome maturation)
MIPITVVEIKQICNLFDLKRDEFIESKLPVTDELIREITHKRIYNQIVRKKASEKIINAFKLGFAYLVNAHVLEFLNTNTAGSGIIRNTGLHEHKSELISNEEIEKRRWHLELIGYSVLKNYLNEVGQTRYQQLRLWDDLRRAGSPQAREALFNKELPVKTKMALL